MNPSIRHLYETARYLRARAISRARAKGRCDVCGVADRATRQGARVILCTRHLDGDAANNAQWNLAQLCQRCHFRAQRALINLLRHRKETRHEFSNRVRSLLR